MRVYTALGLLLRQVTLRCEEWITLMRRPEMDGSGRLPHHHPQA
ncbi:hypothetical protein AB4099_17750 [Bosea sp. 2KB_26]